MLEAKLRTGCVGWSYEDWAGPFYPVGSEPKDWLQFYSRVFDTVEVDSTFYSLPTPFLVERWARVTPPGFLFCPKLPKAITHDSKLEKVEPTLSRFYSLVKRLGDKLGPIVIQLPPSVKIHTHGRLLEGLLERLDPSLRHAIEFRHRSWFDTQTYTVLSRHRIAMVWSINMYVDSPPEITSDFVYLRFIGDRELTSFAKVQKDRTKIIEEWAFNLKRMSDGFERGFAFSNNHFAGFAPETINSFRAMLGLSRVRW